MNDTPLISIVTVCYNAAKEIEKTILSVINQTYSNVEYIIVDGGSTDGTVDVIRKYENKITKWISEPDKGIYDAMNKAIDMATGEWINFMNAGDQFVDDEVVSRLFSSDNIECDVLFGNTIHSDKKKIREKGVLYSDKFPAFGHQSSFVKTQLMKKYHFDTNYKVCADFAFFYRLYKEGRVFNYIDTDIALYDVNGFSGTHKYILYKEHCAIENKNELFIKALRLKFEDSLPPRISLFIDRLKRLF